MVGSSPPPPRKNIGPFPSSVLKKDTTKRRHPFNKRFSKGKTIRRGGKGQDIDLSSSKTTPKNTNVDNRKTPTTEQIVGQSLNDLFLFSSSFLWVP